MSSPAPSTNWDAFPGWDGIGLLSLVIGLDYRYESEVHRIRNQATKPARLARRREIVVSNP
jgi:hypothetical protein